METRDSSTIPVTDSSGQSTERRWDTRAPEARVPGWVWAVLGSLALALVVVTVGLFVEARDASTNADAASTEASQLLDDLVADVKTTNDELSTFNAQFESAVTSAQAAAAGAKQKQSQRASTNEPSP